MWSIQAIATTNETNERINRFFLFIVVSLLCDSEIRLCFLGLYERSDASIQDQDAIDSRRAGSDFYSRCLISHFETVEKNQDLKLECP